MKAVIQRVVSGSVRVEGDTVVSSIGRGIVALVGIHRDDTRADLDYIVRKLVNLRLWEDEGGRRWAKSAKDLDLEILCVSQFTLYHVMKVFIKDLEKSTITQQIWLFQGNKPDFHLAMSGDKSKLFYEEFLAEMKKAHGSEEKIKNGVFGAMMEVNIVNDGPVTLELDSINNAAANDNKKSKADRT